MHKKLKHVIEEVENILKNELFSGETELIHESYAPKPDRESDEALAELDNSLEGCTRCKLHENRTKLVFGVGNPNADLMFVGEGPGAEEDRQGEPFVGRAGKLLDKIILAMGLERADVYIGNVVKCRPPQNRTPELDEIETCSRFLFQQISIIKPKVICCLGLPAAQTILKTNSPMKSLRGNFYDFGVIKVLPTYHPAYLLRNPAAKRLVWEDIRKIMEFLGL